MAVVADFTVPADSFPLGAVFASFPDVEVELDRVVPLGDGVVPYFWVHGPSVEGIEAAFAEHVPAHRVEVIDSVDARHLLRVTWASATEGILQTLVDSEVTLLSGTGTATEWQLEVRAESRAQVADFEAACRAADIHLELRLLHAAVPIEPPDRAGLTAKQREAVELAYRRGYFDTPRTVVLEELAEELGISRQALSSRLRRALNHVVGESLDG